MALLFRRDVRGGAGTCGAGARARAAKRSGGELSERSELSETCRAEAIYISETIYGYSITNKNQM